MQLETELKGGNNNWSIVIMKILGNYSYTCYFAVFSFFLLFEFQLSLAEKKMVLQQVEIYLISRSPLLNNTFHGIDCVRNH